MDSRFPIPYDSVMFPAASPLLTLLRQETDALHQALHVHPLLAPLTEGSTLEQYQQVVRAFHHAYRAMQRAIAYETEDYPNAPALAWLEQDMAAHGLQPLVMPLAELPAITSRAALLGHLYVKQGSTLGGQVISKHLARQLGLKAGVDNHFFAGYGEETGKEWKAFVTALDAAEVAHVEVVAHALASFTCITESCDKIHKIVSANAG